MFPGRWPRNGNRLDDHPEGLKEFPLIIPRWSTPGEELAGEETLSHGRFGPWLRAEFSGTERTAALSDGDATFRTQTERISDVRIDLTAAYLPLSQRPLLPSEASNSRRTLFGKSLHRGLLESLGQDERQCLALFWEPVHQPLGKGLLNLLARHHRTVHIHLIAGVRDVRSAISRRHLLDALIFQTVLIGQNHVEV